ncbi:L-rhamnose isomerase [Leadbettera azotonutricia]|uniref:L-rhamnose isomerase n=1 Tax=Leadbettera azotonutricia (strain ATCC BAA-888 / DSM 13862 / ZAS-9) TaxID=545695 RepID=F5YFE0_LEAAZ|nr:L-rhamnose isomerase [Leadbettera azotonutricia]AEF81857.1 L-rhamnose isomerase [Leadbettera azotonutricia ZAS-9]
MYKEAMEVYKKWGVDTEKAIKKCATIPVSLHCWQGDDVTGFEKSAGPLSGGIQATGNYPGKARNKDELQSDLDMVYSLIPGKKRLNLHTHYAITDESVGRDMVEPRHFEPWLKWAKKRGIGIDFNATPFSHPMAASGLTLSSPDKKVREYWIRHCKATRKIAAWFGEKQGSPCLHDIWIPDGIKDVPADRLGPRERLRDALDEIYSVKYNKEYIVDVVESKLFGIGLESYTTGSSDFYIAYAASRGIYMLLDNGHFHPTELVSDKISSLLSIFDKMALHVTRSVRWDSDHVVLFEDEIKEIAKEIIRNKAEDKVLIGLDYFDASINRIAAWAVGARNFQKALLNALLIPHADLKKLQDSENYSKLLAMQEELKTLPFGAVWDEYLARQKVPGADWYGEVEKYEKEVLSKRK